MKRRDLVGLLVLIAGLAWLVLTPIATNVTRLAVVTVTLALWIQLLLATRNRRAVFVAVLAPPLVVGLVLMLPGRPAAPTELRRRYVDALATYEGVPYVWGGENSRGIDCSGLIRKALVVAECREAVATANPALLRDALRLWAHDASAKTLKEGYSGRTEPLFAAPSINEADDSKLLPGDFAVTADGTHTLAYVGNHLWTQADPGPMRVTRVERAERQRWPFQMPVVFVRWRVLNATSEK